jgi:hypothetical protein
MKDVRYGMRRKEFCRLAKVGERQLESAIRRGTLQPKRVSEEPGAQIRWQLKDLGEILKQFYPRLASESFRFSCPHCRQPIAASLERILLSQLDPGQKGGYRLKIKS